MLVLSRKPQQQILIPELNIAVTVLSVGSNRVQLGISAPNELRVVRGELSPETQPQRTVETGRNRTITFSSCAGSRNYVS
ncbi:MAG: carbon storage regulator [Planctomycetaceae bacterium]|nr:carbon storage regulator [Planctomycetaceae bacterium]MCA9066911.1 carbon storage regulator [Planctomycetaceae bacterium]